MAQTRTTTQVKLSKYRIVQLFSPVHEIIYTTASSGIVLLIASGLALILANSPLANHYNMFLNTDIGILVGSFVLKETVQHWINDGLMAIFFLLVGLEIKREFRTGILSNVRVAMLPIVSAIGGATVPAILYMLANRNSVGASGWGIPMATDIAFVIGVLALLGNQVPIGLKVFLTALAIIDDLIAVLVIAIFYSTTISSFALGIAFSLLAVLLLANLRGVTRMLFYITIGCLVWLAFLRSGVHATIAGVLVAWTIPMQNRTLQRLEHNLRPWVMFGIMPLFALANAGIGLSLNLTPEGNLIALGVSIGLLLGKPIGLFITTWITVRTGIAVLPQDVRWSHMLGAGLLAGIGFTMSIFIASLSFSDEALTNAAKLGIFTASTTAAILGFLLLRWIGRPNL